MEATLENFLQDVRAEGKKMAQIEPRIWSVQKSNEAEFLSAEFGGSAWPTWFRSGDVSRLTVEHAHCRDPDIEGGRGIGTRALGRVEGSGDRSLLDQAA